MQYTFKRTCFCKSKISQLIPLNPGTFQNIDEEKVSYFDQLVYRFTKLQDTMGDTLFPAILRSLEEDPEQMSMLDILNRLEKLNIINSVEEWVRLRNLRNEFTHEYEDNLEENSKLITSLYNEVDTIYNLFLFVKQYVENKIFPYFSDEEINQFNLDTPDL